MLSISDADFASLPKASQRLLNILSQFDMDRVISLDISWKEMGEFNGDLVMPVVSVKLSPKTQSKDDDNGHS